MSSNITKPKIIIEKIFDKPYAEKYKDNKMLVEITDLYAEYTDWHNKIIELTDIAHSYKNYMKYAKYNQKALRCLNKITKLRYKIDHAKNNNK